MAASSTQTRNADSKGRLTLGERFANRTVLIEDHGCELVIRLAKVIPEQEAWLYENKDALTRVRRGLKQAREGRTTKGPDLAAARRLADSIPDDE
jgi:hypothetical protein